MRCAFMLIYFTLKNVKTIIKLLKKINKSFFL
jgi:hypothetical protein